MAKRTSTLAHSKKIETQVARYLWGDDASRDWTERHDISGVGSNGVPWVGEVKDYSAETLSARGGDILVAYAALDQVISTRARSFRHCFSWIHRKRRQLDLDVVAIETPTGPRAMLGKQFKALAGGAEND